MKESYFNEEGLVIMTGGEGEEGEKVILKNCLNGELNPGLQRESPSGIRMGHMD